MTYRCTGTVTRFLFPITLLNLSSTRDRLSLTKENILSGIVLSPNTSITCQLSKVFSTDFYSLTLKLPGNTPFSYILKSSDTFLRRHLGGTTQENIQGKKQDQGYSVPRPRSRSHDLKVPNTHEPPLQSKRPFCSEIRTATGSSRKKFSSQLNLFHRYNPGEEFLNIE